MTNQRTLDMLHHSIYGDPDFEQYDISEDELSHHGVLGMSWGKRHGPPYPLGGVDKRVARAEAKRKREKERRLKKLQKAAKKARKLKKREEKEAADIQKKKQKLVKKGDMDAIKKNAKLFTNEELQYIVERDEAKRSILGKKERDEQARLEDFSKKMGQVADVALKLGTVIGTVKQGADMVSSFKSAKLKDLEIEDKRRASIQKEFEMRFGKDDHSPEAQRFIDRALAGEDYKAPKETKGEKAQRKMEEDRMQRQADAYFEDAKTRDKAVKDASKQAKADVKAQKKADKTAAKIQKSLDGIKYLEDATGGWSANGKNSEWNVSKKRQSFDYPDWYASSFDPGKSSEVNGKSFASSFLGSGSGSASTFSRESVSSGKSFLNSKYKLAGRSSYSGGFKKSFEQAPSSDAVADRSHAEAWGGNKSSWGYPEQTKQHENAWIGERWNRPETTQKNKYAVSDRSMYRSIEAYKKDQNRRRAEESRKAFEAAEKRAAESAARAEEHRRNAERIKAEVQRKEAERTARAEESRRNIERVREATQKVEDDTYKRYIEEAEESARRSGRPIDPEARPKAVIAAISAAQLEHDRLMELYFPWLR